MFRKIGLLLPLGFLAFDGGTVRSSTQQQQDSVSVIPEPAHVSRGKGTLDLHHGLGFDTSVADADAVGVARYLQGLLATAGNRGLMKFSSKTTKGVPQLQFAHRDGGLNRNPRPTMYIPVAQMPDAETALNSRIAPLWWVVRSNVDPHTLVTPVTLALRGASGGCRSRMFGRLMRLWCGRPRGNASICCC